MTDTQVIGIVLFDGVEELDAVGPWEVLANWTLNHPEDGYRVITLASDGGVVTSAGVSAGIDLALHLVSRLSFPDRAVCVRRAIQYDPQPPV